jgi:signal transduction histidine kinase
LNLDHRSPDIFSPDHLALLESIAAIIGPAIHNARLYEASQHQATERTAFAEIGRIINSSTDIQSTYQQFVAVLQNVIRVDFITIRLITPDQRSYKYDFIWQSGKLKSVSPEEMELSGSAVEQITQTRSSMLLSSTSTPDLISKYPSMPKLIRNGINSGIGVPLVSSGEAIGVLSIGSADVDAYSQADVEKLERIGAQIAGALANAQSHAEALESERARLSAEAATRELELLDEQRTDFLSTVSHELKTPLTSLIAFADILARNQDASMNARQLQQISVMQRSARRLDLLINDLLDVSRLDAGTFTLTKTEFDVTVLIQEMGTAFSPLADTNEQLLSISYPDGEFWIEADRDRIAQVITNLLSNASKYSLSGAEIALAMEAEGNSLSIRVTDGGIGMSQETLDNVFTAFYRANDQHTLSQSGSGLGMMIVKSIVELHGGTITVSSEQGVGTTVRVLLPEYNTHPSADHVEAQRAAQEPVAPKSRLE